MLSIDYFETNNIWVTTKVSVWLSALLFEINHQGLKVMEEGYTDLAYKNEVKKLRF